MRTAWVQRWSASDSRAPVGTSDLCASAPDRLIQRWWRGRGCRIMLQQKKNLTLKTFRKKALVSCHYWNIWAGRVDHRNHLWFNVNWISYVCLLVLKQLTSVTSQKDPPARSLHWGDAFTLHFCIVDLLEMAFLDNLHICCVFVQSMIILPSIGRCQCRSSGQCLPRTEKAQNVEWSG